jgi:hypothetical protein
MKKFIMTKQNETVFIENKILAKIFRFLYKVFKSMRLSFSESQITFLKSVLFKDKDIFINKINDKSKIDKFIEHYYRKDFELIKTL